ncbi:MAG: hypothetical protein HY730_07950 [Candidatus Tectomicrobia bacterium]|uniref:Uncharacterized protein n=1 Tax=Tectimicrobiota bacterium TaxID=2528274 RepID=A0A933GNC7_UNCTE|nr:hypothetical protein [Candidatus Tectomicrobia bacterium]
MDLQRAGLLDLDGPLRADASNSQIGVFINRRLKRIGSKDVFKKVTLEELASHTP